MQITARTGSAGGARGSIIRAEESSGAKSAQRESGAPPRLHLRVLTLSLGACCLLAVTACASGGGAGVSKAQRVELGAKPITNNLPRRQAEPSAVDLQEISRTNIELATHYYNFKQYDAAQEAAIRALAATPESPTALSLMGFIQLELNDMQRARAVFERAITLDRKGPQTLHNYATYLCRTGKAEQAIAYFDEALKVPTYRTPAASHAGAGLCYRQLKRNELALARFEQALQLEPANAQALLGAAETMMDLRGSQGAQKSRQWLRQHLLVAPASAQALHLEVRIARALGNKSDELMGIADLKSQFPHSEQAKELALTQ